MGDLSCVMHGHSHVTAELMIDESKLENSKQMLGIGDSISLGRFMNEPLSWEKWSTFSHKKYVEEAESYSQPGLVAQKKAFFEAHYKRMATLKEEAASAAAAASQLQQSTNSIPEGANDDEYSVNNGSLNLNSHILSDDADCHDQVVKKPDAINGVKNSFDAGSSEISNGLENNAEIIGTPPKKKTRSKKKLFYHFCYFIPSVERENSAKQKKKEEAVELGESSNRRKKKASAPEHTTPPKWHKVFTGQGKKIRKLFL